MEDSIERLKEMRGQDSDYDNKSGSGDDNSDAHSSDSAVGGYGAEDSDESRIKPVDELNDSVSIDGSV